MPGFKKTRLQTLKNVACQAMPLSYEAEKSVKPMATCEAKQKWIRNEAHF